MKNITTHVCLVSGQPLPNLIPLIDPKLGVKRAILLVTPDMEQRADWLKAVLQPRGIAVEIRKLTDAWDFEGAQSEIMELLDAQETSDTDAGIALNATGGTKMMSIAAYEAFRAYELPVFYVHPERDELVWLQPGEQPPCELADRLKIEPFLQAHGARVEGDPRRSVANADALAVARDLVERIEEYGDAIGQLNWLSENARRASLRALIEEPRPGLEEVIDIFATRGYIQWEGNDRFSFPDGESLAFVMGGWMEVYVFDEVRRLRDAHPRIHDVAWGVNVNREQRGKQIPNELDVVFLHNNRLHIIECKTRRFREVGEDSAGAEALYKLDALRDLMGGLQARAMLVSYRDLPGHDRTRAADLGIAVCAGAQLRNLKQHLTNFMGG